MTFAFDCERMKHPHTGLFEFCHQLGMALKNCAAKDEELIYYLLKGDQQYFSPENKFLYYKLYHKILFPNYKGIDLWHIAHQSSDFFPKDKGVKKILTIHDLNFLYEDKPEKKRRKYMERIQRNIDLADQIVAISNYTKNDILRHLDTGNKPIKVIYNGVTPPPAAISGYQPAYRPDGPFLFALGTVNAKKNFHILIPILQNTNYKLLITGKTDQKYAEKIKQEAIKYQVQDQVILTGPVNTIDKDWYFQHCEAFLFPSIAEGFGIPPIEAMNYGKPVFLSSATSLPEIGGEHAYYFDSFSPEEIRNVFQKGMDNYQKDQPSAKIIAHAGQFQWANCASQYLDLYRDILK